MRALLVALVLLWSSSARAQVAADTDGDGVSDADDHCPADVEDVDAIDDADGCPEHGAKIAGDRLELLDPIAFATGKPDLLPGVVPSLEAAAKLLKQRAHRKLVVDIGVHTDAMGSDGFNLTMSQKRADAVKAALVAAGLPPARVKATGFGETRPIDSNGTAEGRARNRRVELQLRKK
jgi:outer membrane protein OmpA-like peptidoglycan-associated protein